MLCLVGVSCVRACARVLLEVPIICVNTGSDTFFVFLWAFLCLNIRLPYDSLPCAVRKFCCMWFHPDEALPQIGHFQSDDFILQENKAAGVRYDKGQGALVYSLHHSARCSRVFLWFWTELHYP